MIFLQSRALSLKAQAILLDLGISIYHYEESGRGFTFRGNETARYALRQEHGPQCGRSAESIAQKALLRI
jgi:16S rRNA (cytosine1402-N4)-methyltransferase